MAEPTQKQIDEANNLSGSLEWTEVMEIARNEGYKGHSNQPGAVARYLAFRLFKRKRYND